MPSAKAKRSVRWAVEIDTGVKGTNMRWEDQTWKSWRSHQPFWDSMPRRSKRRGGQLASILQTPDQTAPKAHRRSSSYLSVKQLLAALPYPGSSCPTSILRINDPDGPSTRWQIRERFYEEERLRSNPSEKGAWAHARKIYNASQLCPVSYCIAEPEDGEACEGYPLLGGNCAAHGRCIDEQCPYHQKYYRDLKRAGMLLPAKHVRFGTVQFLPEVMVLSRWQQCNADDPGADFRYYQGRSTGHDGTRNDEDAGRAENKDLGRTPRSVQERLAASGHRIGTYRWHSYIRKPRLEVISREQLANRTWLAEVDMCIRDEEAATLKTPPWEGALRRLLWSFKGPAKKAAKAQVCAASSQRISVGGF